jgi:hypothetical protein
VNLLYLLALAMVAKRKVMEVDAVAQPLVLPTDSLAVQAILTEFRETWDEEKWVRVFSSLSDEDTTEMRQHFKKTKFIQSSLELLKRMPAYQQMVEQERRHSEVLRHAKAMMEKELFERFSKKGAYHRDSALDLLNRCKPPPVLAGSSGGFASPFGAPLPPSAVGSPFGASPFGPQISGHVAIPIGAVPLPCGSPFGSSFGPRPPSGSASSGDGYVIATPPSGSPFGGELADPVIDLAEVCALELAMASAVVEEDDDEDL